jgi:CheY-like chemotaxis protein
VGRRPLRRILLVEDDPDIQTVASLALQEVGGFTVAVCGSARDAVRTASAFGPDLILLDVLLPGMDGTTAFEELRRLPATARTPVVFMTAKVQPQELARYDRLGSLGVIAKPFDPMRLSDTLNGFWRERHG